MSQPGLTVGVTVKEIATTSKIVWPNCRVLHSDTIGLVFEVERTVTEGDTIERVVSQVMVPWTSIQHVLLMEEHT